MGYLICGGLVFMFVAVVSVTAVSYALDEKDLKTSLMGALKYVGVIAVVISGIICATALLTKGLDVMGI